MKIVGRAVWIGVELCPFMNAKRLNIPYARSKHLMFFSVNALRSSKMPACDTLLSVTFGSAANSYENLTAAVEPVANRITVASRS
jgi:hypothetical protein